MKYEEIAVSRLTDTYGSVIADIRQRCTVALSAYEKTGKILYHGTLYRMGNDILFLHSPENRQPVDTPVFAQEIANAIIRRQGCKADRSNSIFATTDPLSADTYGERHVIIPVDGFDFMWWENGGDMYYALKKAARRAGLKLSNDSADLAALESLVDETITAMKPTCHSFTKALASRSEILIHGAYYRIHSRLWAEISDAIMPR